MVLSLALKCSNQPVRWNEEASLDKPLSDMSRADNQDIDVFHGISLPAQSGL